MIINKTLEIKLNNIFVSINSELKRVKKMFMNVIFLYLFLFFSQAAHATFISGNELFKDLDKDVKGGAGYAEGHSSGYITGVSDAFDGILFCVPDNVTIRQVKYVVYNHMKDNPADWNKTGDFNIIKALKMTWPCKKI